MRRAPRTETCALASSTNPLRRARSATAPPPTRGIQAMTSAASAGPRRCSTHASRPARTQKTGVRRCEALYGSPDGSASGFLGDVRRGAVAGAEVAEGAVAGDEAVELGGPREVERALGARRAVEVDDHRAIGAHAGEEDLAGPRRRDAEGRALGVAEARVERGDRGGAQRRGIEAAHEAALRHDHAAVAERQPGARRRLDRPHARGALRTRPARSAAALPRRRRAPGRGRRSRPTP